MMNHKLILLACGVLVALGGFVVWQSAVDGSRRTSWERIAEMREARTFGEFWDALTGKSARLQVWTVAVDDLTAQVQLTLAQAAKANKGGHDWPMFGGTPQRNMVNPTAKN